jgi:RNA polymerase sigma-70 factor (ECF subfamily)
MDDRVVGRFDASDVVQETLLEAHRRLPEYLQDRRIPFYPWIRHLAWERLVQHHRKHIRAQKRSVTQEQCPLPLSDHSESLLADCLIASVSDPGDRIVREEERQRVRTALKELRPHDREILELRYLEQMDPREVAATLNISIAAVNTRHFRAVQRLQVILGVEPNE